MSRVFFLLALICLARADEVNYQDCGCKIGKVISVEVAGCDTSMRRCILNRNTNITVDIKFTSEKNSDKANVVVHGIMLDVPIPFPLPNPDACKDSGIVCPIETGNTYTYTNVLPVLKSYPRATVDVKWEIQDGGEDYICVIIPAKLH